MIDFTDKVVVVTGAAGALGGAVVANFETLGARVVGLDIAEQPGIMHCDLFDPESCVAAVTRVRDQYAGIDILVNVAGGFAMGEAVHETSAGTWQLMHDLNAGSVLHMAQAVVPAMLQAGAGKIVNIAARAGLRGAAGMGAYVASKSVVIRLTETLSEELRASGINVNCVLPSIIDTPANRAAMPDADFSQWVAPASLAGVIGFLASDLARDVHGAALPVEGLS